MSRKCFLTDGDEWFAVDEDRKGFFNVSLRDCIEKNRLEDWENFEQDFGFDRLDKNISSYSFDNLKEMFD